MRIPVGRVVGRAAILRNRLLKRLLEIARRKQIAGLAVGPRAVRRRPKIEVPVEHVATGIDAGLGLDDHGGAIGFPLVFLGARVLELDGLPGTATARSAASAAASSAMLWP